jgi:hypothetical protein
MTELAKQTQYGLHVYGMVKNAEGAVDKLLAGDLMGAALDATEVGINAWRFMQSCFAAGTKLLTLRGWVPIEKIVVGDFVWSKPEDDPNAAGEWKCVEELFVRSAPTLVVLVGGRTITTTAEHPIYVRAKGWAPAGLLEAGDLVMGKDGEWTAVEEVERTGRVETVYNLRVQDFSTYFVGGESWGFSVWAHNAYNAPKDVRDAAVAAAWKQEADLVRRTGQGTRNWTAKQMQQLLDTGKVRGYVGHHINSVNDSPLFAGLPENIQFLTFRQHYRIHNNGRYRIPVYGEMLSR